MKKILGLTIAALLVMALVGGGTWAYFSDVETSSANIFSAGTLDLNIDGDNVNVNMLTLSDIEPGDTDAGSPGTCELKNIGSITGDLKIATGALTETESTGTTGTADSGTTTTMVDDALTEADDYWIGYALEFTSGLNNGEERIVTDFAAGTDTITVASAFTNAVVATDAYSLHTEYELDVVGGAGVGELGGYVTLSIWLDTDGSGPPYVSAGTDVQLLTGDTFDSAAQVFDSMADLASQTWTDCITGLAQGNKVDVYIEWNFADSGDQNDAQGDSTSIGFTFTLEQQ